MFPAVCAVAAILLFPVFRAKIPDIMRNDRVFLYSQTLHMIADAPISGHGIPSFEQAFLPFGTPRAESTTRTIICCSSPRGPGLPVLRPGSC